MDETKVFLDISTIRNIVANYFNIDESLFDIDTRKREIVVRRQMVHLMCCLFTKNTLAEIGKAVGCKDHATVLHSKKTINNLVDTDYSVKDYSVKKWYNDLEDTFKKMQKDPKYFIDKSIENLKKTEKILKVVRKLDGIDNMILQIHGMILTLEQKANHKPSFENYLLSWNKPINLSREVQKITNDTISRE